MLLNILTHAQLQGTRYSPNTMYLSTSSSYIGLQVCLNRSAQAVRAHFRGKNVLYGGENSSNFYTILPVNRYDLYSRGYGCVILTFNNISVYLVSSCFID